MQCPRCPVELLVSVREEIEIDCCPQCGGIWLDRGELMKMIVAYVPVIDEQLRQHRAQSNPADPAESKKTD